MMMIRISVALMLAALSAGATAQTGGLTPEAFVLIDVEVREVTINGMDDRLTARGNGASDTQLRALHEDNRERVDQVYAAYGTTPGAHAAFGTRHADAIAAWLSEHPDMQRYYTDLESRFEQLSGQFRANAR